MTGGALGSLFAQLVPPLLGRAQDAAGRRRGRGHGGDLRHADGGGAAGGRAAALRVEAAQLHPGGRRAGASRRCCGCRCSAPGRSSRSPLHAALGWPRLVFAVVVGLLAGFGSGLLTALVYACEDLFAKLPIHWMWWPIDRRPGGGRRRPASTRARWAWATTSSADLLRGTSRHAARLRPALRQGGRLVGRAGLGHLRRRARAAADHGRRPGSARGSLHSVGDAGLWAMVSMAAMMGGTMRSPLTAMVFALELTARLERAAGAAGRLRGGPRRHRAAHAPVDPHREARPARAITSCASTA